MILQSTLGRHIALKGFLANSHPSPCPLSTSLPHSGWRERPGSFTLRKLRRCEDEKLEQTCTPSIPPIYGVHIIPQLCTCIYIYIYTFTHVYKYIYIYICFHMFEDSFHLRERKKSSRISDLGPPVSSVSHWCQRRCRPWKFVLALRNGP